MKIRVVGWTEYDSFEFREGENSWAVRMAVVDEIRKNGYFFSGYDHQERQNCAPVFNDGKMRRFSQRGFADMMAEAQGDTDYMAYAAYMFGLAPEDCRFPEDEVCKGDFPVEKDLAETFVLPVDEPFFANAPTVERTTVGDVTLTTKTIKLPDLPELRYIDEGDTLVLTCNGERSAFRISEVTRDRDLTPEERIRYMTLMNAWEDLTVYESARKEFMALPIVITLKVKQRRKYP